MQKSLMKKRGKSFIIWLLILITASLTGCESRQTRNIYSESSNWVYLEDDEKTSRQMCFLYVLRCTAEMTVPVICR